MKDKDKTKKSSNSDAKSYCYHVIDACGCKVGSYCCEESDMSKCNFYKCC
jgi:hypothetical protein